MSRIAYFSMEIALREEIPTYSGGLGVLAGDYLHSVASLNLSMVAVTLIHRKGYFSQSFNGEGWQQEAPQVWPVEQFLQEMGPRVKVQIEKREVSLRAWKYDLKVGPGVVPVFFLDADLPENSETDRSFTDFLYGGDSYYRLCQEIILGIGGVRMLRALGYHSLERYHMNEGHSSLLTLELLDESAAKAGRKLFSKEDVEQVKKSCIFTTHTPVEAGHDKFSWEMVYHVLGREELASMKELFCCGGLFNMTFLGFNFSRYINGVAKRHGIVAKRLFENYAIESITNGVFPPVWTSPPFQHLYDRHLMGWKEDHFNLRYAVTLPKEELWQAHLEAKGLLAEYIRNTYQEELDLSQFTIGIGRRAATYKRLDLLLHDISRLKDIVERHGPIQVVYGSKAHPHDMGGKKMIQTILAAKEALKGQIRIFFLQNYDVKIAKLMTAGVDLWLNTPEPPLEASGTSGMKAALNGVPSLSILDGWWVEGCIEGITGWAIGLPEQEDHKKGAFYDASFLYEKLEKILPLFYTKRDEYLNMMAHAIALNGSFFNTQRMVLQYVLHAYF